MQTDKRSFTVEDKEVSLFTTVYPKREAETIIFLHGGPGLPDGLTFIEEYLAERYQVISFHQRGTLQSPLSQDDYSMKSYLADIDKIAAYVGIEKFHLLGHSWGGLYAQIYAEKNIHKLLSLFLCSPASGTGLQWAETQAEIARYNFRKSNAAEKAALFIQALLGTLGSDKGYENLYKQLLVNFNKGFVVSTPIPFELGCVKAKAITRTTKEILQYPLLHPLPDPGIPITIVYGDGDIYGDSKKYVQERYPTANIHFITHSGHLSWAHHPQAFIKVLENHFK